MCGCSSTAERDWRCFVSLIFTNMFNSAGWKAFSSPSDCGHWPQRASTASTYLSLDTLIEWILHTDGLNCWDLCIRQKKTIVLLSCCIVVALSQHLQFICCCSQQSQTEYCVVKCRNKWEKLLKNCKQGQQFLLDREFVVLFGLTWLNAANSV